VKRLTITRPESLQCFSRRWANYSVYAGISKKEAATGISRIANAQLEDSFTADVALSQLSYIICGVQMVCDKDLSRDLEVSTLSCAPENLVWPAPTMWLMFADEGLPCCLLSKRFVREARPELSSDGFSLVLWNKDGAANGVLIGAKAFAEYITGDYEMRRSIGVGDVEMPDDEAVAVRYMASLAAKVLAYASIPKHAPLKIATRSEKKSAGIHPAIQGPSPALLVRHLPRVIRDTDRTTQAGFGAHSFYGRAGHIRHYEAERYTNVKGTWQWIAPIPPPDGVQVQYRVRKVKATA
jgi:hypothetical protein